jgi:hypothetical protein
MILTFVLMMCVRFVIATATVPAAIPRAMKTMVFSTVDVFSLPFLVVVTPMSSVE